MTDSPTAAQVAQMMERLNNLAGDMQELKSMLVNVISMQRDVAHMDKEIRRLFTLADQNAPEVARLDKRTASLERWHKILGTTVLASLGVVGWGVNRVEYLYRMDSRISMLEFLVNGKNVEQVMGSQLPIPTGKK